MTALHDCDYRCQACGRTVCIDLDDCPQAEEQGICAGCWMTEDEEVVA